MKIFIILFAVMAIAIAAEETYSSEYDNLDVEAVVNNPQTLQAYFGCFIDRDNCEKEPGNFKKDLSEAIKTACAKCTPAQKHILKRFTEGLKEKFPQDYETFKQKFDPEGKYFVALEPVLAKA
uniref:Chemosensory protein n=1 Tax=Eogystia hippophaecolus TaxID=1206364 RepID=A0A1B3P5K2_EOGHI|nr:chemosensory protein [Eogystia hippophaecolus]